MVYWLAALAGGLAFGTCLVAAMVLPRHYAVVAVLAGLAGFIGGLYSLGTLSQTYSTPPAIAAAIATLIAGIVLGYAIATSSLPNLARTVGKQPARCPGGADAAGIILLGCAEADRYDPRAIAYRQNLLREEAGIELPLTAVPFVFLTEKARYRAVGNVAPAVRAAHSLVDTVRDLAQHGSRTRVDLAHCHIPGGLASVAAAQACAGAHRIAVVVLGPPGTMGAESALASLTRIEHDPAAPAVVVAPPVWEDGALVRRMAERVLACTAGAELAAVGVALISAGAPEEWDRRHPATAESETYFNQRVRMALMEAGIDGDRVRAGWLDWQAPDATEAVRHLAALGCQHIIVAPSTTVLPTLETTLDLERAVVYARVPGDVRVVTLGAWGDDDVMAQAIYRAASAALDKAASNLHAL